MRFTMNHINITNRYNDDAELHLYLNNKYIIPRGAIHFLIPCITDTCVILQNAEQISATFKTPSLFSIKLSFTDPEYLAFIHVSYIQHKIEFHRSTIKGILPGFIQRALSKISKFECFTSLYSAFLKHTFPQEQKSFQIEIRVIFP